MIHLQFFGGRGSSGGKRSGGGATPIGQDPRFKQYIRAMSEDLGMVRVERGKVVTTTYNQQTYDFMVDTFKGMTEEEKDSWLNHKLKKKWGP